MPLSPGAVLPKDMDQRQFSRWCREQAISPDIASVGTTQLEDEAVTFAKIVNITANRFLGRLTSTGDVQELTFDQTVGALEGQNWSFSGSVEFTGTVGFFGVTPVGQQTTYGSVSLAAVSGSGDDSNINGNFAAIESCLNLIKTALDNIGITG